MMGKRMTLFDQTRVVYIDVERQGPIDPSRGCSVDVDALEN